ncbi:hypothetical protein BDM02DRAFT_1382290 [Thelephora ganbajun]|uniref:Uncharacterized protein n=1 Tax=Thelephora ganbajun TaxID=370292 RepID=A0ACB6ZLJ2_THEGA|nr:hypothetical protein BDM02DRAFT_1382290 [Thelephora ganbajun]
MTSCHRNIWCELSQILLFFPQFLPCPKFPTSPGSDNIRPSPSLQMPLPPGEYQEVPDYLCTCKKCGPRGGKVLPRATWYSHNPGGKKAKLPELSQEQIDLILSLPPPRYSKRRKWRLEEAMNHPRTSKQVAGSGAVRMRLLLPLLFKVTLKTFLPLRMAPRLFLSPLQSPLNFPLML